jgi:tetratricopeptide (TPR) repeat protein
MAQGFIDFENQNFEAALPAFETALDAGHIECALYAGVCASELGRENEMVAYFTTYLSYDPDSAYACVELADYYLNQELYTTCKQYINLGYEMEDRSCDEQLLWIEIVYYEYQKEYNTAYQLIQRYMGSYEVTDTVQREYDFLATRQTLE